MEGAVVRKTTQEDGGGDEKIGGVRRNCEKTEKRRK